MLAEVTKIFNAASMWQVSGKVYETDSALRSAHRLKFVATSTAHRHVLLRVLNEAKSEDFRNKLLIQREYLGFFVWPFLNNRLSVSQRFKMLENHCYTISSVMPWLKVSSRSSKYLFGLDSRCSGLSFFIENLPHAMREGCLNFSMIYHGQRIMTLSFTLQQQGDDAVAYIGCIQGSSQLDVMRIYKEIGDQLNDIRPRDLLFKSFRMLMEEVGIKQIYAVSDACRIYRHRFFRHDKHQVEQVRLPYDKVWQEYDGVLQENGFYLINTHAEDRPLSDINPKNRSRYKKRLAMYAEVREAIQKNLALFGSRTHQQALQKAD